LSEVLPYADIVWEFLSHNAHLDTIGAIKVATYVSGSPQQGFVTLDFPDFDASVIDCETPYGADK